MTRPLNSLIFLLLLVSASVLAAACTGESNAETRTDAQRQAAGSDEELRQRLTPIQYEVTQKDGTEPPFRNPYWDHKDAGLYVDVVSGQPLFSSTHKYKSGTGWPSFWRPLEDEHIVERTDYKIGVPRTEVRSSEADSHLGHVFPDGPEPTGLRYCINSAALRFVPVGQLEAEGYGEYLSLFEDAATDR